MLPREPTTINVSDSATGVGTPGEKNAETRLIMPAPAAEGSQGKRIESEDALSPTSRFPLLLTGSYEGGLEAFSRPCFSLPRGHTFWANLSTLPVSSMVQGKCSKQSYAYSKRLGILFNQRIFGPLYMRSRDSFSYSTCKYVCAPAACPKTTAK